MSAYGPGEADKGGLRMRGPDPSADGRGGGGTEQIASPECSGSK
ncbi:hypothetical protein [Maribellus sediminis]|nr:hypothetical protein [Maribellus sediminis]